MRRLTLLILALLGGPPAWSASPDPPADPAAAFELVLVEKGRAREEAARFAARARFDRGEPAHRALALLADLRGRRGILIRRGPGERSSAAFEAQRRALDHQIIWLERFLKTGHMRARTGLPPPVTLDAVRQNVPPDGALLELVSNDSPDGTRLYVAWVVRRDAAPRRVELGPAAPIDRAAEALRAAARDPDDTAGRARAEALSARLLTPLWPHLGAARHWIVAPDGPLHMLPFELLVTPDGRWLDETHAISYLAAGRRLARLDARIEAGEPPLIVADPAFAAGHEQPPARVDLAQLRFPRLPGTADEGRAIAALLPDARLVHGAQATEAVIKRSRGPLVLHLATHGFFLGAADAVDGTRGISLTGAPAHADPVDPQTAALLDAGLALAGANRAHAGEDGVLTALEASALDLRGTALVVLSACETGLGRPAIGEGLAGFREALAVAGAESQLLTLWKVDDGATRALMTAFYGRLAAGARRIDAVREARALLRADPRTAHPFYWAAFTLSGDWRAPSLGQRP